jgi:hypothetical protein
MHIREDEEDSIATAKPHHQSTVGELQNLLTNTTKHISWRLRTLARATSTSTVATLYRAAPSTPSRRCCRRPNFKVGADLPPQEESARPPHCRAEDLPRMNHHTASLVTGAATWKRRSAPHSRHETHRALRHGTCRICPAINHTDPSPTPTVVDPPPTTTEMPPHRGRRLGGARHPPSRADTRTHRQTPLPSAAKDSRQGHVTTPSMNSPLRRHQPGGRETTAAAILTGHTGCADDPLRQQCTGKRGVRGING